VAMELRGYGDSFKPPNIQDYQVGNLVEDVIEMIQELG